VVFGDAPAIGKVFVEEPDVAVISFTGSVATGRYLMSEAGRNIKRVSLELGGNAPFIVCADADLDLAADDLLALKCSNSGQVCISANRVFVEGSVHEVFLEKVRARLAQQRVGPGTNSETTIGPLIGGEAAERVNLMVQRAIQEGARVVHGGNWPLEGLRRPFFPPTLLDRVTPEMTISGQEIFGPVIPVTTFDRDQEVMRWANNSYYGLAAYVYTTNLDRAHRFSEGLEVGVVGINDLRPITPEAPFGGIKQSGIGREGGIEGMLEFLDQRLIGTRYK
jgi:succinate-semialdehyde dehydrogenase/glutarate-semialdehyde dehydrogenase